MRRLESFSKNNVLVWFSETSLEIEVRFSHNKILTDFADLTLD